MQSMLYDNHLYTFGKHSCTTLLEPVRTMQVFTDGLPDLSPTSVRELLPELITQIITLLSSSEPDQNEVCCNFMHSG